MLQKKMAAGLGYMFVWTSAVPDPWGICLLLLGFPSPSPSLYLLTCLLLLLLSFLHFFFHPPLSVHLQPHKVTHDRELFASSFFPLLNRCLQVYPLSQTISFCPVPQVIWVVGALSWALHNFCHLHLLPTCMHPVLFDWHPPYLLWVLPNSSCMSVPWGSPIDSHCLLITCSLEQLQF